VGSGLGGLEARVSRHLRSEKKLHWHIDYLLQRATITGAVMAESIRRRECDIARALEAQLECIRGFGASDCRCAGHLFRADESAGLETAVFTALDALSLTPRVLEMAARDD
jgi:Uri superfamily endonuclease